MTKSHKSQAIVVFWIVFIVVIICVFMVNAPTIQKNFNLFRTRLNTSPNMAEEQDGLAPYGPETLAEEPAVRETPSAPPSQEPAPAAVTTTPARPQTPAAQTPSRTEPQPEPPSTVQSSTVQSSTAQSPSGQPPSAQTRDRNIYFTQIDKDGRILHSRVSRKIPVSDSPLLDTLNSLFTGPSADELNRGLINLIPQNTRILSASVRGNTAYINFSEDFLFNTFGVEGYVAQLRQVVWTATEFSNVNDVQILIEGRRLDYLGEGIWIGSPISRQSF